METTRGWSRNTVLRVAPCLFGLYTVVALLYAELPARYTRVRVVDWPGKRDVTFSDAITVVCAVVGRVGFCNPRSSRSLFKTQGPIPANRAQWASPGGMRPPDGPLAEARAGIVRLSQRDLVIELLTAWTWGQALRLLHPLLGSDLAQNRIKLPVLEFCEAAENIRAFQHPLPDPIRHDPSQHE